MSLDKQKRAREAAAKQRADFIKEELAATYGQLGPYYSIGLAFTFKPDFFPGMLRVRHVRSAVANEDKNRDLPVHEDLTDR